MLQLKTARSFERSGSLNRNPAAILLWLCLLVTSCCLPAVTQGSQLTLDVMSFNVRWDGLDTGRNAWQNRLPVVVELFESVSPDVCGLQEPSKTQTLDLDRELPDYSYYLGDHSRDETIPIFYKHTRLTLLDSGSFWLIDESELSGGTRRCVWVRLKDKRTEKSFYVYNCHLDHRASDSRFQCVRNLVRNIAVRKHADSFVICGDFNEREQGKAMRFMGGERDSLGVNEAIPDLILYDTFRVLHPPGENQGTGHGFKGAKDRGRIDYVWSGEGIKLLESRVIYFNRNGLYPSDHFPVLTRVEIPEP